MAESTEGAALPAVNLLSAGREDKPGPALLFIQVQPQTSASTAKPLRTLVRKHVMSQSSRNRVKESPEGVTPSSAEREPGDMRKQLTRFRLESEHRKGQKLHALAAKPKLRLGPPRDNAPGPWLSNQSPFLGHMPIQDPVSTYRRDSFTVFPIHADDEVHSLFTFYLNDLNDKSVSQNPNRDFIPIVLGDSACFHVLLATLLQFQRFQGRPGGPCFWYHRGAAIAALNRKLSYQHAQITDTMFCTVGMLLYLETRVPTLRSQTAGLHIAALIKFLELRKGILKVEIYCMLLRLAIWCSINPPLTRPPSMVSINEQDFDFELKLPCSEENFTPFPKDIFDDLKHLVGLRAELGCDPMLDEEDERRNCVYQDFVSRCLARASTSLSTPPTANVTASNAVRCIQLGQILFLYTICPSMSVSGVYCQSIAVALRACLEVSYGESGDPVRWAPEVLCWLLVNGLVTNQVKALQAWYLRRVADFMRHQGIQTFGELEALLRKVVWTEDKFGSACRSIWIENLNAQALER